MKFSLQMSAAVLGLCVVTGSMAAQPVVIWEKGSVKVTDEDVLAEVARAPKEVRVKALESPATLTQIAQTLAARRNLAQEMEMSGQANKPEVKAQVKLATERLLSDLRMEQYDAQNAPDAKAIEDYARSQYRANTKAFEMPPQSRVRHILISGDTPEAKAKAEKLSAELKAGADFEKLARENSDDKANAEKGGDLGLTTPGRYVPEFEEVIKSLKKDGEISQPVQTKFGWHIVQLVERLPARTLAFEEVADGLKQEASQRILMKKRLDKNNAFIKDAKVNEQAIKAMAEAEAKAQAAKSSK